MRCSASTSAPSRMELLWNEGEKQRKKVQRSPPRGMAWISLTLSTKDKPPLNPPVSLSLGPFPPPAGQHLGHVPCPALSSPVHPRCRVPFPTTREQPHSHEPSGPPKHTRHPLSLSLTDGLTRETVCIIGSAHIKAQLPDHTQEGRRGLEQTHGYSCSQQHHSEQLKGGCHSTALHGRVVS